VQYAPPGEVYERPRTRFVADFIGATAFLAGRVLGTDADGVRVQLKGDQYLTVATAQAWPAQQAVTVAVRSERVQVVTSAAAPANTITAHIVTSTYLGSKWQHEVETTAGAMKVESLDAASTPELRLYVPPSAVILLPAEEAA
jgi:iron(III) transport system ATP-binding protein